MSIAPGGPRHRAASLHMEIADVVRELNDTLTARMVAGLAGVKDAGQARKWARGDLQPSQPAQQRLRFAHDQIKEIEGQESIRVAQRWMLSINPRLKYDTPVKAIREDRYRETAAAAQALLEETYNG